MVVTYAPPRSAAPIRVALLGTGFGEAVHLPALRQVPDFAITAVCSRRAERAHAAAKEYGASISTTDYREVVERSDIDAVIVATPPHLHHTMTMAALAAGKHVLCEKPMAKTVAEARDMVRMAERAGVIAMVNHEFRFMPARTYAKELIEGGYIGEPYSASMTFYRSSLNDPKGVPFTWLMEQDKAGGMLGAIGSHHIDCMRWWFGDIRAASGVLATMVPRRRAGDSNQMLAVTADDNFALVLQFQNNAIGTIHYSATATHEPADNIILSGSGGTLVLTADGRIQGGRKGQMIADLMIPEQYIRGAGAGPHPLIHPTVYLLKAWAAAIRSGTPASPSFEDGFKVQEVVDAIGKSVQTGRSGEMRRGRVSG
ncbi:MAG: Gfo/Idh/MocA family oxidoreductase [Chloroflexota bacterium]|jgi:predicted dehydrogenase|nr:Gfo/Idh/MocA family oxidoreductase [Chloroflexota bacterium]